MLLTMNYHTLLEEAQAKLAALNTKTPAIDIEAMKAEINWALQRGAELTLDFYGIDTSLAAPSIRDRLQLGQGDTLVAREPISKLDFRCWDAREDRRYLSVARSSVRYVVEFLEQALYGIRPASYDEANYHTITAPDISRELH